MLHLLYLMMSSLKKLLSPNKKGEELATQKLRRGEALVRAEGIVKGPTGVWEHFILEHGNGVRPKYLPHPACSNHVFNHPTLKGVQQEL